MLRYGSNVELLTQYAPGASDALEAPVVIGEPYLLLAPRLLTSTVNRSSLLA